MLLPVFMLHFRNGLSFLHSCRRVECFSPTSSLNPCPAPLRQQFTTQHIPHPTRLQLQPHTSCKQPPFQAASISSPTKLMRRPWEQQQQQQQQRCSKQHCRSGPVPTDCGPTTHLPFPCRPLGSSSSSSNPRQQWLQQQQRLCRWKLQQQGR